jgi:hypothetical protein
MKHLNGVEKSHFCAIGFRLAIDRDVEAGDSTVVMKAERFHGILLCCRESEGHGEYTTEGQFTNTRYIRVRSFGMIPLVVWIQTELSAPK